MNQFSFSKNDMDQIKKSGLTLDKIHSQLELFHQGTPFVHLERPCTVGDGIQKLSPDIIQQCIFLYETQGVKKKLIKFVPASGAATRMFEKLIYAYHALQRDGHHNPPPNSRIKNDLSYFLSHCRKFAFYDDLKSSLAKEGLALKALITAQDHRKILRHLLTPKYMNYAMLPKGLIKFHAYENHFRTAFEEHLVEAGGYARNDANKCILHFTVSPGHMQRFISFFHNIQSFYKNQRDTTFDVSFSIQGMDTNTIAVDAQNRPFRLANGSLLFRPGGHGALINNLNQLDGDIVFIKNIDNVAHECFISKTIEWKKILCGYLIQLQQQIFDLLNQLHKGTIPEPLILKAIQFLKNELSCGLPEHFERETVEKKLKKLIQLLNRPLRVCGMVPNTGEPGGGPFWIKDEKNHSSIQIIETSQINKNDNHQRSILNRLTHFNPVDLVCGIRNFRGELFDLSEYVDHEAVFISNKSEDGRDLKALELPGLWNGAMAFWNTAFVEVPAITFNPVKEVTDLLHKQHRHVP